MIIIDHSASVRYQLGMNPTGAWFYKTVLAFLYSYVCGEARNRFHQVNYPKKMYLTLRNIMKTATQAKGDWACAITLKPSLPSLQKNWKTLSGIKLNVFTPEGGKYRKLTLTKATQIFVITMWVTFQFQAFSKHILSSISHYLVSSVILHCLDIWFSVALRVPHCQYLKYLCSENL